jgi:hypothetical protein
VPRRNHVEEWLTLALLVPAWANELADSPSSPSQLENDLWQRLYKDVVTGSFDRSGLGVIHNGRFASVIGQLLFGPTHLPFRRIGDRILAANTAIVAFSRRHGMPPPSCCSNATKGETKPNRSPGKVEAGLGRDDQ